MKEAMAAMPMAKGYEKGKGEITRMSIDKDGVLVCVAHGNKKKKSESTKNSMAADYDDRPTTHVQLSEDAAKGLSLGDKVEIKVMKLEDESEAKDNSEAGEE